MTSSRLLSLLLVLSASALLHGAAPAAADAALEPTKITCGYAEAISTDKEMTATFTEDVVVTGTNMSLHCDKLEVISYISGEKDQLISKENQFKSLIAQGHVRIVQGSREATCGRAEVLPGEDRIILSDKPVVIDSETGWTYKGQSLYLLRGERRVHGEKVTFTGPSVKDLGFDKKKQVPTNAAKPGANGGNK